MIIKSLTLTNFRQYKGTQEIKFSTDSEKNVTVIIGKNTAGKTTIVQSFLWCLYGTCSFKTKEVLNVQIKNSLSYHTVIPVIVKINLVHEGVEYNIQRQQDFSLTERGDLKTSTGLLTMQIINSVTKNTSTLNIRDNDNRINQILPFDLSDYFFFDGERIESINDKRNVVDAVRGLMKLDVVNEGVKHLDPNKQASAIGKLRKSFDLKGKENAEQLQAEISRIEIVKTNKEDEFKQTDSEIDFYEREKVRLQEKLDSYKEVKELQASKKHLEDKINMCLAGIKRGQQTLSNTFNNVYYAFFAKPLLKKGIETLSNTKHDMRGVPEMDARSIDFILNRGRCICGRCLKTDEEAIKAILYEKSLLPPHEIGSTIRATIDSAKLILDDSKDHYGQIKDAFAEICKQERMLDDTRIDLQNVVDKIKKVGNVNIAELEDDYQKANKILNNLNQKKGRIKGEIAFIEAEIDSLNKKINSLVISNEKNRLIERAVACATEVYNWFKTEYDRSIADVKARLTIKINETFNEMYHGERVVEIDDDYRIKLLAPIGGNRFKTDESKGLEAVKNFSFICGLVALAREKAVLQSSNNELEKERAAEPYPIVMDAPFSNVDEIHIRNISKILPSVAEQVILIVMNKDWEHARTAMEDRVGAYYNVEKVNNSDTHSIIRRV